MQRVIQQSVVLPAVPEALFDMYLDPAGHAAITGSPATIGAQPGAQFQAFEGQLSGTILAAVRPHLIVQSWRSIKFNSDDLDSTLILTFTPAVSDPTSTRIDLVHLNVPEHDFQDVTEGWPKHYWEPWQRQLEQH